MCIRDRANTLRPALVPGEQISIRLVKSGEQPGQGVGYLDDGTMVVAEGGAQFIGEEVALLVTSTMQTTAGRLVFARPVNAPEHDSGHDGMGMGEPPAAASDFVQSPLASPDHAHEQRDDEPPAAPGTPAFPERTVAAPLTPPARPGPFPPKPATRRGSGPSTPRNPRRWPPTAE